MSLGLTAVTNPIPATFARAIPTGTKIETIGRPDAVEAFVTDADALKGLSAGDIADAVAIDPSATGFTVIEFPSSSVAYVASPVFRPIDEYPGFVGGGQTAGGAPEWVVPNGELPEGTIMRTIPPEPLGPVEAAPEPVIDIPIM